MIHSRKPALEKLFKTEVDLCAAFIKALPPEWISYNEVRGWDILLVRKSDGFQIGVQAKLKLNVEVINQAIEEGCHWQIAGHHPDCRAVLVPHDAGGRFGRICGYVGLTVIRMRNPAERGAYRRDRDFDPDLPHGRELWKDNHWYEMAPAKRHKLPEYVPDVPAGASSPLQLTDWKIKAIKIAVTLEMRGHVTRRDFAHHQIDHRRWVTMGWLKVQDGKFVRGSHMPNFKRQHPIVFRQIVADRDKWALSDPQVAAKTEGMLL